MAAKMDTPNPIKAARKKAGLTQAQAAKLLGWSQPSWNEFENGDPDRQMLGRYRKVAKALRCKLVDMLNVG